MSVCSKCFLSPNRSKMSPFLYLKVFSLPNKYGVLTTPLPPPKIKKFDLILKQVVFSCLTEDVYGTSHQVSLRHHTGAILGVCGTLFIFFLLLVVVITWRRYCKRKPPLQFWTVELKDDHEQVSFSSMLDQPDYHNVDASLLVGDMPYDDQPGERHRRGNKHSNNQYQTLRNTGSEA